MPLPFEIFGALLSSIPTYLVITSMRPPISLNTLAKMQTNHSTYCIAGPKRSSVISVNSARSMNSPPPWLISREALPARISSIIKKLSSSQLSSSSCPAWIAWSSSISAKGRAVTCSRYWTWSLACHSWIADWLRSSLWDKFWPVKNVLVKMWWICWEVDDPVFEDLVFFEHPSVIEVWRYEGIGIINLIIKINKMNIMHMCDASCIMFIMFKYSTPGYGACLYTRR